MNLEVNFNCTHTIIILASIETEISAVLKSCVHYFTATFDIQNSTAEGKGDGITVKGDFITDSFAKGCLIVLKCNETTEDKYQAIPWNGSEPTVSETIKVPSSTYTVYAYDIENNGLPYVMPANIPENVTITAHCKFCT